MNMFDWFKHVVVDNYANFKGRARRSEYWYFTLVYVLVSVAVTLLAEITAEEIGLIDDLLSLALFVPGLAVVARRLHDTGRSGWWQLIGFTIIGLIPLFIWMCLDGEKGPNKYGADPKAVTTEDGVIEHFF